MYEPKSLFYLCKKKVRQFPELEKRLFHCSLLLDYEYTFEKIVQNILRTVSSPYSLNNKSFERYFRRLVREHVYPSDDAKDMLERTQKLLEKIKSFRKIFGIVSDVFYDLCFLEWELVFLVR